MKPTRRMLSALEEEILLELYYFKYDNLSENNGSMLISLLALRVSKNLPNVLAACQKLSDYGFVEFVKETYVRITSLAPMDRFD